jgi:hypothetical protein
MWLRMRGMRRKPPSEALDRKFKSETLRRFRACASATACGGASRDAPALQSRIPALSKRGKGPGTLTVDRAGFGKLLTFGSNLPLLRCLSF